MQRDQYSSRPGSVRSRTSSQSRTFPFQPLSPPSAGSSKDYPPLSRSAYQYNPTVDDGKSLSRRYSSSQSSTLSNAVTVIVVPSSGTSASHRGSNDQSSTSSQPRDSPPYAPRSLSRASSRAGPPVSEWGFQQFSTSGPAASPRRAHPSPSSSAFSGELPFTNAFVSSSRVGTPPKGQSRTSSQSHDSSLSVSLSPSRATSRPYPGLSRLNHQQFPGPGHEAPSPEPYASPRLSTVSGKIPSTELFLGDASSRTSTPRDGRNMTWPEPQHSPIPASPPRASPRAYPPVSRSVYQQSPSPAVGAFPSQPCRSTQSSALFGEFDTMVGAATGSPSGGNHLPMPRSSSPSQLSLMSLGLGGSPGDMLDPFGPPVPLSVSGADPARRSPDPGDFNGFPPLPSSDGARMDNTTRPPSFPTFILPVDNQQTKPSSKQHAMSRSGTPSSALKGMPIQSSPSPAQYPQDRLRSSTLLEHDTHRPMSENHARIVASSRRSQTETDAARSRTPQRISGTPQGTSPMSTTSTLRDTKTVSQGNSGVAKVSKGTLIPQFEWCQRCVRDSVLPKDAQRRHCNCRIDGVRFNPIHFTSVRTCNIGRGRTVITNDPGIWLSRIRSGESETLIDAYQRALDGRDYASSGGKMRLHILVSP